MHYEQDAFLRKSSGAYLPHWTREGATYAVVFRLGDSLPAVKLAQLHRLREAFEHARSNLTASTEGLLMAKEIALRNLYSERADALLDAGAGECYMRNDECAAIVANCLLHFAGHRYVLHAWAIMPNHVHVVFKPHRGFTLSSILHSWKSFSAKQLNAQLKRSGPIWQKESYDHLVRGSEDFAHHVGYTLRNPESAGLKDWPWVSNRAPSQSKEETGG